MGQRRGRLWEGSRLVRAKKRKNMKRKKNSLREEKCVLEEKTQASGLKKEGSKHQKKKKLIADGGCMKEDNSSREGKNESILEERGFD